MQVNEKGLNVIVYNGREEIKRIRIVLNLSEQQFARRFHLEVEALRRWEAGEEVVPEVVSAFFRVLVSEIHGLMRPDA